MEKMAKVNLAELDGIRVRRAEAEQAALRELLSGAATAARVCPYCHHKAALLFPGAHAAEQFRCANCGEEVIFPPVVVRRARRVTE